MAARRGMGQGSLRDKGDGNWLLVVSAGTDPDTGKRQQRTRSFKGNKTEAQRALRHFAVDTDVHPPKSAKAKARTVADAVEGWWTVWSALVVADDKSKSTERGYRQKLDHYILPILGPIPLVDLSTHTIETDLYARMLTTGKPEQSLEARKHGQTREPRPLAAATVTMTHAILRQVLDYAVNRGWLDTNPALKAVKPSSAGKAAIVPPTPAQVAALLAEAASDPEWACLLRVAVTVGDRRGETAALRWSMIDLDTGKLTIARAAVVDKKQGVIVQEKVKTKRGYRTVSLDPATTAVLKSHRLEQKKRALACGVSLAKDPYVFAGDIEGCIPVNPDAITRRFTRLRNRLGMPDVRLHDLRHYLITQLLGAGVDIRTVAGRAGNDPAVALRTYAAFLAANDQAAANIMGDLVDGTST